VGWTIIIREFKGTDTLYICSYKIIYLTMVVLLVMLVVVVVLSALLWLRTPVRLVFSILMSICCWNRERKRAGSVWRVNRKGQHFIYDSTPQERTAAKAELHYHEHN
jgi:hypothetical protein